MGQIIYREYIVFRGQIFPVVWPALCVDIGARIVYCDCVTCVSPRNDSAVDCMSVIYQESISLLGFVLVYATVTVLIRSRLKMILTSSF